MKRKERWKSGWYQFSSDLDRALGQGIFLAAVLVIAAAISCRAAKIYLWMRRRLRKDWRPDIILPFFERD